MKSNEKQKDPNLAEKGLIYGGIKMATAFAGYPANLVRTRMYADHSHNIFSTFNKIRISEGMLAFYKRGFTPAVGKMGAKEFYRGSILEFFGHRPLAVVMNALADTATLPLDKAQTLQQLHPEQKRFAHIFRGMFNPCAFTGLFESYRGATFCFGRQLTAHGFTVGFQKVADYALKETIYKDELEVPFLPGLAGSTVAGLGVAAALNPFSRALTILQSGAHDGKSAPAILLGIVEKEGIRGLARGNSIGFFFAVLGQMGYYSSKWACAKLDESKAERHIAAEVSQTKK